MNHAIDPADSGHRGSQPFPTFSAPTGATPITLASVNAHRDGDPEDAEADDSDD